MSPAPMSPGPHVAGPHVAGPHKGGRYIVALLAVEWRVEVDEVHALVADSAA